MRDVGDVGVILVLLGRKLWRSLGPEWNLSISVDAGDALAGIEIQGSTTPQTVWG